MTVEYGANITNRNAGSLIDVGLWSGRLRVMSEVVTMASQATTVSTEVGVLPIGARFAYGMLQVSVTAGATATLAIGITGATGKYRAAATQTATTPSLFGVNAAVMAAALTAEETILLTIAAAALAAAGRLVIQMYYTVD